jgi:hypothetical protein
MNLPCRLLAPQDIKAACQRENPGYVARLSDPEWEQVAVQLEALARLIWEFSQRQAAVESRRKADGPYCGDPMYSDQTAPRDGSLSPNPSG